MSDLVGRLRNPAWEPLPGDARQLHIERTLADMREAADEIERLTPRGIYLAYKEAPPSWIERVYARLWRAVP